MIKNENYLKHKNTQIIYLTLSKCERHYDTIHTVPRKTHIKLHFVEVLFWRISFQSTLESKDRFYLLKSALCKSFHNVAAADIDENI